MTTKRRFKLQTQVTADGFMAGSNGELDWMVGEWSEDFVAYLQALTDSVDTIVLGRMLAEGFIPAWASRRDDPQGESEDVIAFMNDTPRVVISRTLESSPWPNATIASDLGATVADLKAKPGKGIIAYGGSTLVQNLIAEGLLEELHLCVHPVALGSGLPIFPDERSDLRLVGAYPFSCGVTAMHYEPRA